MPPALADNLTLIDGVLLELRRVKLDATTDVERAEVEGKINILLDRRLRIMRA